MLTEAEKNIVRSAVQRGLQRAKDNWREVGDQFVVRADSMTMDAAMEAHVEPSKIPNHPWVTDDTPKVDEFVAVVVDMRDSSKHLKTASNAQLIPQGFARVYFETSGLLPAVAVTCEFEKGIVTEYLGDGALVLFPVDKEDRVASTKAAFRAADNCVNASRIILNEELKVAFGLPSIDVGAGLSLSQALVTLVGAETNLQAKAIGSCVWEATKLSGGRNAVYVSESVKLAWPSTKNGKLHFSRHEIRGVAGYRVSRNDEGR